MSDEHKEHEELEVSSIEDIEGLDPFRAKKVVCPNLSQIAGKAIVIRVRPLQPMDLFKVSNFPLAELHRMTDEGADGTEFQKAMQEHLTAFEEDDLQKMVKEVLAVCVVEPEPTAKLLRNLEADAEHIFGRVMSLTTPAEVAEAAATFREE